MAGVMLESWLSINQDCGVMRTIFLLGRDAFTGHWSYSSHKQWMPLNKILKTGGIALSKHSSRRSLSRNPTAYKWKCSFRVWMLREAVFWRLHDLMTQSYALYKQRHILGARILLRSGFESLATLIYLNQIMQQVLDNKLDFHAFGRKHRCCYSDRGTTSKRRVHSISSRCWKSVINATPV